MGYWAHMWQLDELLVGDDEHPEKTMEYWSNNEPATAYDDPNEVTVHCVYDAYSMTPILQEPQHHRFADVGAYPVHDCEWEGYLTEEDINRFWVDDEGNWLRPEFAPEESKAQLRQKQES